MNGELPFIDQFVAAARQLQAVVHRIDPSPDRISATVLEIAGDARTILLAEPDDLPPELLTTLAASDRVSAAADDRLAEAAVGVTDAFAGVARTGSVCVPISAGYGCAASLFPRTHIVLLDAGNIVPAPRDLFTDPRVMGKGLTRSFVFITGPSVTADMGKLVYGVHGPDHLHIILLEGLA